MVRGLSAPSSESFVNTYVHIPTGQTFEAESIELARLVAGMLGGGPVARIAGGA